MKKKTPTNEIIKKILKSLKEGNKSISEVSKGADINWETAQNYLNTLTESGVLDKTKGKSIKYRLISNTKEAEIIIEYLKKRINYTEKMAILNYKENSLNSIQKHNNYLKELKFLIELVIIIEGHYKEDRLKELLEDWDI